MCVLDSLPHTSAAFEAQHEKWSASADIVCGSLFGNVDTPEDRDQDEQWPQAFQLIEKYAFQLADIKIPTLTVQAWKEALATTKRKRSKGCCK